MELFGRKEKRPNDVVSLKKSEEEILKKGLEDEIQELQKIYRVRQEEIKENEVNLHSVKEEYDSTVTSLMEIKKESNQKILELDVVKREYKDIRKKNEESVEKVQENNRIINEIEKNKRHIKKVKQEIEELAKKENEILGKISEGQAKLHEIKLQETQNQGKSEKNTPRLNNKNPDSDDVDNTFIFSDKEKEFIKDQIGPDQYTKGVIEAASVVTASLKSKLNVAHKELETMQRLLEKERKEHMATKETLEKLQNKNPKNTS